MKKFRTILILTFLLLVPINLLASEPFYCLSKEITHCLNITKEQCIQATEKAYELCANKYNLFNVSEKDALSLFNEVGNCATKEFLLLASISDKELQKCEALFEKAAIIEHEKVKKEQEEYDKRFFEE